MTSYSILFRIKMTLNRQLSRDYNTPMKNQINLFSITLLFLFLTACASVDYSQEAIFPEARPDQALIYFYRTPGFIGSTYRFNPILPIKRYYMNQYKGVSANVSNVRDFMFEYIETPRFFYNTEPETMFDVEKIIITELPESEKNIRISLGYFFGNR